MTYQKQQQQQQPKTKKDLSNYIEVNVRIEKFWQKYPDGRIETHIVSWENGVIIMSATIYKNMSDEKPSAIGHAYEKEGSSFINSSSALENCETSAVGRALAILGFEIKKSVASKEEVQNAQYQQQQQQQKPITNTTGSIEILENKIKELSEIRKVDPAVIYKQLRINSISEANPKDLAKINKALDTWLTNAKKEAAAGEQKP